MTTPLDKLIDIEAEQAALGACLIDPDAILQIADDLSPDDFHDEGHGIVYRALLELYREGQYIDTLILSRKIDGQLSKVGVNGEHGEPYLTRLVMQTPTSLNVQRYAKIVHRLGVLRRLMGAAGQIAQLAYGANGDALDAVFARADGLLRSIAPDKPGESVLLWLDSLGAFYVAQIERVAEQEQNVPRVEFPWPALKTYVPRVREGMLVVVSADSSVGKTAFLECEAEHLAQKGLQVAFFHLELSHQMMLDRRMARHSGVPIRDIENGLIDDRMGDATRKFQDWPGGIHYVHCPGWSAPRIVNQARQLQQKGRADVVIVDYFQKVRAHLSNGLNLAQARGAQAEAFKVASEQMAVPWFVAAQFSNASRGRAYKSSSDIRDTGELLQKSNVAVTLDRELDTQTGQRAAVTNIRIDKNTTGPTGGAQLYYMGPRFAFTELSLRHQEDR